MTGYRGRFSVVEVLTMNIEMERLIGAGANAEKIAEAARLNGMRSLFDSGLKHVLAGETSTDELLRVVDVPMVDGGAAGSGRISGGVAAPKTDGAQRKTPTSSPVVAAAGTAAPVEAPARRMPEADLSGAFDLLDEESTHEVSGVRRALKGISVLLVDDEDSLRKVMKDLLTRDGYQVLEARTGIEALDQTDRHAPDIIVLDLNLPGMDGYSVLKELRTRPATQKIPVIVLTAKGDEDNEVRVFELGADDFLSKPFRAKALSKRLENVLGRRK
jgi:CheY-like chemotaxis protein